MAWAYRPFGPLYHQQHLALGGMGHYNRPQAIGPLTHLNRGIYPPKGAKWPPFTQLCILGLRPLTQAIRIGISPQNRYIFRQVPLYIHIGPQVLIFLLFKRLHGLYWPIGPGRGATRQHTYVQVSSTTWAYVTRWVRIRCNNSSTKRSLYNIHSFHSNGSFSISLIIGHSLQVKAVQRIQITIVLVIIFSRYWSKSIIRIPLG